MVLNGDLNEHYIAKRYRIFGVVAAPRSRRTSKEQIEVHFRTVDPHTAMALHRQSADINNNQMIELFAGLSTHSYVAERLGLDNTHSSDKCADVLQDAANATLQETKRVQLDLQSYKRLAARRILSCHLGGGAAWKKTFLHLKKETCSGPSGFCFLGFCFFDFWLFLQVFRGFWHPLHVLGL